MPEGVFDPKGTSGGTGTNIMEAKLITAWQTGRDKDSVPEEQIGRALEERVVQVHPHVGIAGSFINPAIADKERPGRHLLGIKCDGTAYHSSRSARDRDRLRQAVLEDHG